MGKFLKLLLCCFSLPLLLWIAGADEDAEAEPEEKDCVLETVVRVKWFPEDSLANTISTYTYNTYWLDYLLLLRAENGTFEPERRHNGWTKHCVKGYDEQAQRRIPAKYDKETKVCYWEWKAMYDWWLCWFNEYWHPEMVYNENFHDRQRQVDRCVELKKGGTVFYWWNGRYKHKNDFIFTEEIVCH